MAKQANKTVIGGFVLGAVTIFILAVLTLGSGKLFKKTASYVLYFDDSIKGLDIGAPVMFRGVKIGSVTDIKLKVDPKDMSIRIPVITEIEPDRISSTDKNVSHVAQTKSERYRRLKILIDRGLRAQLQMQSVVTGKLFVALDFFPDKPAIYHDYDHDQKLMEVPTVKTSFSELADFATKITSEIRALPLEELITGFTDLTQSISKLVKTPEARESIVNMENALESLNKFLNNLNSQVPSLTKDYRQVAKNAQDSLAEVDKTLKKAQSLLAEQSPAQTEFVYALENFSAAARSFHVLADYLQRHPEALLRGKGESSGGK